MNHVYRRQRERDAEAWICTPARNRGCTRTLYMQIIYRHKWAELTTYGAQLPLTHLFYPLVQTPKVLTAWGILRPSPLELTATKHLYQIRQGLLLLLSPPCTSVPPGGRGVERMLNKQIFRSRAESQRIVAARPLCRLQYSDRAKSSTKDLPQ